MSDFKKIFDQLQIDNSLLPVLMNTNRSTLHKYLNGSVAVPASAMSLIKLLQLLKVRSPELFREWLILQEFQSLPEHYLEHPNLHKAFEVSTDRMRPVVREYLELTKDEQADVNAKVNSALDSWDSLQGKK